MEDVTLTVMQIEAYDTALHQIREADETIPRENMSGVRWSLLTARAVVKAGLYEVYPPDTDFNTIAPGEARLIGDVFLAAYYKALAIPKKNGLTKSAITFTTPQSLPPNI